MVLAPHPFKTIFFRQQVNVAWIPPPRFLYTKKVSNTKNQTEQPPHPRALEKKTNKKFGTSQRICGLFDADGVQVIRKKTSSPKWFREKMVMHPMGSQSVTKKHLNTKYWIHQLIPPAHMKGILENGYICWFPKMLGFPQQPWVNSY